MLSRVSQLAGRVSRRTVVASRRCATSAAAIAEDATTAPAFTEEDIPAIVDATERRVMSIFTECGGNDYIGEPFSITEHSVQTAAAARHGNETDEAVLSCLLHDIGHMIGLEAGTPPGMDGCGTEEHERVGAEFLGQLGFSDVASYLALHHVNAKRYQCARDPEYLAKLSDASVTTLRHQGGPMSEEECLEVEKDPRWPLVLRMRGYDEAGKDPSKEEGNPEAFRGMIRENVETSLRAQLADGAAAKQFPTSPFAKTYVLSEEQLQRWDEDGFLVISNALPEEVVSRLDEMAEAVAAMPDSPPVGEEGERHPWLKHYELVDGGEGEAEKLNICRVENFCKHDEKWGDICFNVVQDLVSQAYREPAVLFKDKMNFKGPGGGSFLLHQDATAYATDKLASRHISVMVAVDAATPENGPLEVSPGRHNEGIFKHDAGVIAPEVAEDMEFVPVMVKPGDVVLFDSYLPHKSEANKSDTWRRLAYLTFNAASEGDLHADYYETKHKAMLEGSAGTISINKDFGGKVVSK